MFRTVQNTRFNKCLRIYVLLQYEREETMRKEDDALFLNLWGSNCQGIHAFAGVKKSYDQGSTGTRYTAAT